VEVEELKPNVIVAAEAVGAGLKQVRRAYWLAQHLSGGWALPVLAAGGVGIYLYSGEKRRKTSS